MLDTVKSLARLVGSYVTRSPSRFSIFIFLILLGWTTALTINNDKYVTRCSSLALDLAFADQSILISEMSAKIDIIAMDQRGASRMEVDNAYATSVRSIREQRDISRTATNRLENLCSEVEDNDRFVKFLYIITAFFAAWSMFLISLPPKAVDDTIANNGA